MTEGAKDRRAVRNISGYEPQVGRLLWMLEDGRQRTKAGLVGLTDADLGWSPGPDQNSIGALLYHIAAIEADWLYTEVLEQEFPAEIAALFPRDVRDEEGRLAGTDELGLAAHVKRLDTVRGRLIAAFRGITRLELRRERELPDYTVTPEWVIHHLMQHEAEHRGEIGMVRALLATQRDQSRS
jgi:uncharacterized damage-inducible protein DinB